MRLGIGIGTIVPLENLEVSERMGIILSIRILLRCSLFLRNSLALCLPWFVLARCLRWRTWLCATRSLCCSAPQEIQPEHTRRVVALPQVGGLHHRYERRAA